MKRNILIANPTITCAIFAIFMAPTHACDVVEFGDSSVFKLTLYSLTSLIIVLGSS